MRYRIELELTEAQALELKTALGELIASKEEKIEALIFEILTFEALKGEVKK